MDNYKDAIVIVRNDGIYHINLSKDRYERITKEGFEMVAFEQLPKDMKNNLLKEII